MVASQAKFDTLGCKMVVNPVGARHSFPFSTRRLPTPMADSLTKLKRSEKVMTWKFADEPQRPRWEIKTGTKAYEIAEYDLPLRALHGERRSTFFAPQDFLSQWVREKGRWVNRNAIGLSREDDTREAVLKVMLYDSGTTLLLLEETRTTGERLLYRLDPKWLSEVSIAPAVLETRLLAPGESFEDGARTFVAGSSLESQTEGLFPRQHPDFTGEVFL